MDYIYDPVIAEAATAIAKADGWSIAEYCVRQHPSPRALRYYLLAQIAIETADLFRLESCPKSGVLH